MEVWKDIKGYEGFYKVSNMGNVKRLKRDVLIERSGGVYTRYFRERILKPVYDPNGYHLVTLYNGNNKTRNRVHRFVANAFLDNPENKKVVNHKNGIKADNRVDNLEWCTDKENHAHAEQNGWMKPPPRHIGEKHPQSKLTKDDVYLIKVLCNIGEKHESIGERFNIHKTYVSKIKRGELWSHINLENSLINI